MTLRFLLKYMHIILGPVPAWWQLANREDTGTFYTHSKLPPSAPTSDMSTSVPVSGQFLNLTWDPTVFVSVTDLLHLLELPQVHPYCSSCWTSLPVSVGFCTHSSLVDTGLSVLSKMPMTMLCRSRVPERQLCFETGSLEHIV